MDATGKFKAKVSLNSLDADSEVSVGASDERKTQASKAVHEEVAIVPRFTLVKKKILELLHLMEIRHLNLLIDEWQTLDPHCSTGIQSGFAEYLKRTFAGAPEISVKIATNRYQTRFNNKGKGTDYRGLEVGADIFEATNLDRIDVSEKEQYNFYSSLLFKRLVHCNPDLGIFDRDGDGVPHETFILSIFRDNRAFEELIKGAASTPRDFLLLFNALAKERDFYTDPTWSIDMVHAIVREGVANRQEETDPNSEADQLLTRCVRPIVDITGSRVFFVDRDDHSVVGSAIDELLEKRLIDQFPISNMAPGMATRYDAFIVHYGLWLGWRHSLQAYGNYSLIEIPIVQLADVKKYTLDTSLIEKGFLTCSNCGDVFSVTSRPYKVAGLCPQCFKPVVS